MFVILLVMNKLCLHFVVGANVKICINSLDINMVERQRDITILDCNYLPSNIVTYTRLQCTVNYQRKK